MDTISFKGYSKVDEPDDKSQEFRKKINKHVIILSISLLLLIGLVFGVFAGKVVVHSKKILNSEKVQQTLHVASTIRSICGHTLYPDVCFNTLHSSNTSDPLKILHFSLTLALESLEKSSTIPEKYTKRIMEKKLVKEALNVCGIVLNEAIDSLNEAINTFDKEAFDDLRSLLSGVITDHETCFDALEETKVVSVDEIRSLMQNSTQLASNTLAIVSSMISSHKTLVNPNRRLLAVEELDFPYWVKDEDRLFLHTEKPKPDWTVAKDGSGNFRTIKEALDRIQRHKAKYRTVIYVKAGNYLEYINVTSSFWNVMIYGDGKENTTVSWHAHVNETRTYSSPTFSVNGRGFIAQDIGFINTAGPNANQAVALRSNSDNSIFHRCSFDSFQDTLYVSKGRQFYLNCTITGSIDVICGNAAAVFQYCTILARNPKNNYSIVTITAQKKSDPGQDTGMSFQRCSISKLDDLADFKTYLGRPWKNYSTVVVMDTYVGGLLNPKGWVAWNSTFNPPPPTIFYAEYGNTGDGANTMGRVKWAGYHPNLTEAEALKYNNLSYINGSSWLTPFIAHGHIF